MTDSLAHACAGVPGQKLPSASTAPPKPGTPSWPEGARAQQQQQQQPQQQAPQQQQEPPVSASALETVAIPSAGEPNPHVLGACHPGCTDILESRYGYFCCVQRSTEEPSLLHAICTVNSWSSHAVAACIQRL